MVKNNTMLRINKQIKLDVWTKTIETSDTAFLLLTSGEIFISESLLSFADT